MTRPLRGGGGGSSTPGTGSVGAAQLADGSVTDVKVNASAGIAPTKIAGFDTDATLAANSDAAFPSQKAVKSYVDAVAQGLSPKLSVSVATTAALPSNTYSAGVLTAAGNGALSVDGYGPAVAERVLVKNEAAPARNGIYVVTATGDGSHPYILTRSADMNAANEIPGAYAFVEGGTANVGAGYVVASVGPFTIGTTSITWTQFTGVGEITAGTGVLKSGATLSVDTTVIASAAALAAATSFATSYKWGNN